MNDENLIPQNQRSPSEAREMGRKGGIASGKVRKQRKTIKMLVEKQLFETELSPKMKEALLAEGIDVKELYHASAIIRALINKAEKGDVSAFNALLAIIGEKPKDEMSVEIPKSVKIHIVEGARTTFAHSEDEIER